LAFLLFLFLWVLVGGWTMGEWVGRRWVGEGRKAVNGRKERGVNEPQ